MAVKIKGFALLLKQAREAKSLTSKHSIALPPDKLRELKELEPIARASGFDLDQLLSKALVQTIDQLWDYFRTAKVGADSKEAVCVISNGSGSPGR